MQNREQHLQELRDKSLLEWAKVLEARQNEQQVINAAAGAAGTGSSGGTTPGIVGYSTIGSVEAVNNQWVLTTYNSSNNQLNTVNTGFDDSWSYSKIRANGAGTLFYYQKNNFRVFQYYDVNGLLIHQSEIFDTNNVNVDWFTYGDSDGVVTYIVENDTNHIYVFNTFYNDVLYTQSFTDVDAYDIQGAMCNGVDVVRIRSLSDGDTYRFYTFGKTSTFITSYNSISVYTNYYTSYSYNIEGASERTSSGYFIFTANLQSNDDLVSYIIFDTLEGVVAVNVLDQLPANFVTDFYIDWSDTWGSWYKTGDRSKIKWQIVFADNATSTDFRLVLISPQGVYYNNSTSAYDYYDWQPHQTWMGDTFFAYDDDFSWNYTYDDFKKPNNPSDYFGIFFINENGSENNIVLDNGEAFNYYRCAIVNYAGEQCLAAFTYPAAETDMYFNYYSCKTGAKVMEIPVPGVGSSFFTGPGSYVDEILQDFDPQNHQENWFISIYNGDTDTSTLSYIFNDATFFTIDTNAGGTNYNLSHNWIPWYQRPTFLINYENGQKIVYVNTVAKLGEVIIESTDTVFGWDDLDDYYYGWNRNHIMMAGIDMTRGYWLVSLRNDGTYSDVYTNTWWTNFGKDFYITTPPFNGHDLSVYRTSDDALVGQFTIPSYDTYGPNKNIMLYTDYVTNYFASASGTLITNEGANGDKFTNDNAF